MRTAALLLAAAGFLAVVSGCRSNPAPPPPPPPPAPPVQTPLPEPPPDIDGRLESPSVLPE